MDTVDKKTEKIIKNLKGTKVKQDLVLQTKIGREYVLEKFLKSIGKKGKLKNPARSDFPE